MSKLIKKILVLMMLITLNACQNKQNVAIVKGYQGDIKIEANFDGNRIESINILESHETKEVGEHAIKQLIDTIIEQQSLDVDVISGATESSKALLSGLQSILDKSNIVLCGNHDDLNENKEDTYEYNYDVVVIGGGGAGLTAAISAAKEGKKVALVEKTEAIGGNTLIATAMYNCVDPELQQKYGIEDSEELFFEETYFGGHQKGKEELVRILTSEADEGLQFLKDLGLEFKPIIDNCLGGQHARGHFSKAGNGTDYIQVLGEACEKYNVDIYLNTKAQSFITKDNEVIGVETVRNGEVFNYYGNNVVLATGGFGYNVEMRMKYNQNLTGDMLCSNTSSTLGDGIVMAEEINASLINMEYIELYPMADVYDGGLHNSIPNVISKGILVNKHGLRFIEEDAGRDELATAIQAQEDGFVYSIVDDDYSKDEEEREFLQGLILMGHVKKADTIEELAELLDMDPNVLKKTIVDYNYAVECKNDSQFHRLTLDNKIDNPPYYANAKTVTVHQTLGGVEINENTQVLDKQGNIIKGLFACGEVTGGIHGANRLGGNSFPDSIVFGRIAGRNAALMQ